MNKKQSAQRAAIFENKSRKLSSAGDKASNVKEEQALLLSLSSEIAAVRDRTDMFKVINEKLKAIFSAKEFGIAQIAEDGLTYSAFIINNTESFKHLPDYEMITSGSYPTSDRIFREIIESEDPILLQLHELSKEPDTPAYIHLWIKMGLEKVVCIALRSAGKNIGCAFLHMEAEAIVKLKPGLLKGVCAQIAVATSNVIANEALIRREEEKTILLSLTREIAALTNRADFYRVVNATFKDLFSINEFGIAQIDADQKTYSAFMMDLEEYVTNHPEFETVTSDRYDVQDMVFAQTMRAEEPVLFQVPELVKEPQAPVYVNFWNKVGLQQVLCIALRVGGSNIGCLYLHINPSSTFRQKNSLLKGIASQLSVAISNILANEKIAERERERELLLSLTTDMAAVRNYDGLLKVIGGKLKKRLPFCHTLFAIVRGHGARATVFFIDPQSGGEDQPAFQEVKNISYTMEDGIMNVALKQSGPVIFELDQLKSLPELPLYLTACIESDHRQLMVIPLSRGIETIGFWMVFFDHTHRLTMQNTRLVESLANQVSIAVSNIIAYQDIQDREGEKTRLLAFSNAMASVSDKRRLAKVLKQQLQELFRIDDYTIHALSKDKKSFYPILFDDDAVFASFVGFRLMMISKNKVNDGVCNLILESEDPITFAVDDWFKLAEVPMYAKLTKDMGVTHVTGVRIRLGQENIGFIKFTQYDLFDRAIYQPLFKSICSQIAISLSNIITVDEIHGREEEKARLLAFSNAMASVRDKNVLGKIIREKLQDLFGIDDYSISKLTHNKTRFTPILFDPDAESAKHPEFQALTKTSTSVNDGVFDRILQNVKPVTFYPEEWSGWDTPPVYENLATALNLKRMTGLRLRLGNEDIAIVNFRHDNFDLSTNQYELLDSICSQLAIAVANVIANEDVLHTEKEKSKLLEFSIAIASVRERDIFAKVLSKQLADLFGIRDYAIHVLSEDKKTHRPIFYDTEAEFSKHPVFQKLVSQETPVNDGVFNEILNAPDPVTFDAERWVLLPEPPIYANAALDIGLKKLTGMRLRLGEQNIAVWNFRNDETVLGPQQFPLLKSIASQIAIAISHILANEKVLQQLNEINQYKQQLEDEKFYLKEEIETGQNFSQMIGESSEMKKVFRLVAQVAGSDSTVLLLGETGTGKELIARAIHNASPRHHKLMVKVNCAALPATLIESELFGHERGSFTGATERRIGKFELANHGTLFLDEIGEMPLELQVKLLRALQEKEIERVGGSVTIKTDVRIIAATNRDLEKLMEEGRFRNDLYYRLNIFPIKLPPLRNRREDIPLLANHFLFRFAKKSGKKIKRLDSKVLEQMLEYNWPGNIRELEHMIERSVLLASGDAITEIFLPLEKKNATANKELEENVLKTIAAFERDYIVKVLRHVNGKISGEGGAAHILGIPASTLNSRMKKLGIKKGHFS